MATSKKSIAASAAGTVVAGTILPTNGKKTELSKAAQASAKLGAIIEGALKGYHRGREGVQKACIAVLIHAYTYGDYSQSLRLIEGMGDVNGKNVRLFFEKFGGFSFTEGGQLDGWKGAEYIKERIDAAREKPWYTMSPPNAFKGLDTDAELNKVLTRHNKLLAELAKGKHQSPEEQALCKLQISEATMKLILNLCNFETIDEGAGVIQLVPRQQKAA